MSSIAYESAWIRLKTCARTAHALTERQRCLQTEADRLREQSREVRREKQKTERLLRRQEQERRRLEAFLSWLELDRERELLRLRYLDGLTLPQMRRELEKRGVYYTQRYLEKLLAQAEQYAGAAWPGYAEREEEKNAIHHT